MSGTDQNPYPTCIKCGVELSPQDSRGWMKIIDNSDCVNNPEGSAKEIWLCPNCLYNSQACQDLKEINDRQFEELPNLRKRVRELEDERVKIAECLSDKQAEINYYNQEGSFWKRLKFLFRK